MRWLLFRGREGAVPKIDYNREPLFEEKYNSKAIKSGGYQLFSNRKKILRGELKPQWIRGLVSMREGGWRDDRMTGLQCRRGF